MPARRPDELTSRTPLSTDWVMITPTAGPTFKCAVSDLPAGGGTQARNTQTGTTYTLVLTDARKLLTLNNAAAITVTIPDNAVAFPYGSTATGIDFLQLGAGTVTFAPAGGVTLNGTPGLRTRAQYSGGTLLKVGINTWVIVGDTMV